MLQHIIAYVNFHLPTYKTTSTMIVLLNLVRFTNIYMQNIFKKTLDMNLIMYRLNDGLVDLLFQTNSNVLKNHLIFSYAFSEFYGYYETERGKVYVANTRLKKRSIIGFITAIIYWFLHKGVC